MEKRYRLQDSVVPMTGGLISFLSNGTTHSARLHTSEDSLLDSVMCDWSVRLGLVSDSAKSPIGISLAAGFRLLASAVQYNIADSLSDS